MDLRRTVLLMIFALSVFMLWDAWLRWEANGGRPPLDAPSSAVSAGPSTGTSNPDASALPQASAQLGAAAGAPPSATSAPMSGEVLTLSNRDLSLSIQTVGGKVVKAVLLTQASENYPDGKVVLLDESAFGRGQAQSGLIGAAAGAAAFPNHLSLFAPVSLTGAEALDGRRLVLRSESGGVRLTKTYELAESGFAVKVKHQVENTGADRVRPQLYTQLVRDASPAPGESFFYQTFTGPAMYTEEGKFEKIDFSDIQKNKADHVKTASDGWIGLVQHYFVTAWLPRNTSPREFFTRYDSVTGLNSFGVLQAFSEVGPGGSETLESLLYVGPQEQRVLEQLAPGLDLTVDYGWLTFIAKPIYWLLEQLHGLVGNWGWAIVALTVIIKALFYPLSAAGYKSMARMKAVTPRMMQLRERYANDKAKLNQAVMELYKTEKINPLGGCLPVVVQIPVFLALYWVLLASVEMRNAPWMLWIQDLSSPDPYFILPVIMAATMFLQTKLNPPPPDPLQAKIMMFMPLVFSVFFFFFPAGLVLYWLVNNVVSIAQQWTIMRRVNATAA